MITTQTDLLRHLLLVRIEKRKSLLVVFTTNNITVELTAQTISDITFSVADLGIFFFLGGGLNQKNRSIHSDKSPNSLGCHFAIFK